MLYITQSIGTSWKHAIKHTLPKLVYGDQAGFFEASIATLPGVQFVSFEDAKKSIETIPKERPVVVNVKCCNFGSVIERDNVLRDFFQSISNPKALLIAAAEAETMLPNEVLDRVDVIFKREPFKDRNRYAISDQNKAKIVPTMISCPVFHLPQPNHLARIVHSIRPRAKMCEPGEQVYDVGFSGVNAYHHLLRFDVWERVVEEGFSRIGGLQPNPYKKECIPKQLEGPRYKGRTYRNALCAAKINLALDGIGQYTFRHQELLYLGCFMMSGPSIRELELPMPLEEGKHYVAFDDLDDMVEKIRYYLAHKDERRRIATAGKALFDEYYSTALHGKSIRTALKI